MIADDDHRRANRALTKLKLPLRKKWTSNTAEEPVVEEAIVEEQCDHMEAGESLARSVWDDHLEAIVLLCRRCNHNVLEDPPILKANSSTREGV